MNDLIVASSNGTVTMSSIELVDFINSHRIDGEAELQHKNFLAKVPVVLGQNQSAEFLADYRDARGRAQKCYRFPKREACLMAMSYSYDLQAKVFDRMTELESRQHVTLPSYADTLRLYADQIEETQRVTVERDNAIATKALIGSKREATAMAKASAAVRKVRKLEAELGFNAEHATVVAVERATGRKFPRNTYVALRRWCHLNDTQPASVTDPRYGFVKAWPAGAWLEHEGIDLKQLFPSEALA